MLFFLIIVLLKAAGVVDIFGMLPNKYYFIPVLALWITLVYRYYTKEKAFAIVQDFEQKPLSERRVWGVGTIVHFILPIVIIALLLKK